MQTEKVHLTKEKETLLATLYARALESRSPNPILQDEMAEGAVRRIDYDFERLKVDTLSIAMRAKQFDLWTTEYLTDHPDAAAPLSFLARFRRLTLRATQQYSNEF